jgi:phage/plasmid-like protein (TIGR03299 family)
MAHAVETFEDGTSAFFSNREIPWHKLGTITDGAQTAEEALRLAQLDWKVYKSEDPINTTVLTEDGVVTLQVDGKFVTYRNHPKAGYEALGIVGNQYTVIQNTEAFDFLNALADESGAVFETAGSLNGGRQVFMSMKMPNAIELAGGQDTVDLYLMATTSHNGSKAFTAAITPIRPVCANTVAIALSQATSKWYLKHTSNVTGKVQQAREALGLVFKYEAEFEKAVNGLAATKMSDKEFNVFLETLIKVPAKATERQEVKVQDKRAEIASLWNAPTQQNVKGTAWAAFNAVTEWSDWARPMRASKGNEEMLRAERLLGGLGEPLKNRAFALLSV